MEVCALASGSSGNCFYVANAKTAVLVDAGISAKQTLLRMERAGCDVNKVRAIFITHEHSDHILGVDVLARKLNVPLFATKQTLQHRFICSEHALINCISNTSKVRVGNLSIETFSKSHSAADPVSFTIADDKRISIITDAGYACTNIQTHIAEADFVCLESNHDEHMLATGPYTPYHKKWVASDTGHLSNKQAALCVRNFGSKKLQRVVLSHLSKINNTPDIALKTFKEILTEANTSPIIDVSVREEPTLLFTV